LTPTDKASYETKEACFKPSAVQQGTKMEKYCCTQTGFLQQWRLQSDKPLSGDNGNMRTMWP
jgi:hypothetical protein